MNNIKQIQEFNRRKIICAVHNTEDYEEALRLDYDNDDNSCGIAFREYEGKSITLNRVLLALKHKQIGFLDGGLIEVVETNGYYKEEYNYHICDWDLEKTLEEQSPETQIAIAKLLGIAIAKLLGYER